MATLRNRSRTMQVFNLPHESYCKDGECHCGDVTQHFSHHDGDAGVMRVAEKTSKLGSSLHFLAGETKSDLPDSIIDCPEIKSAIARRDLMVVKVETSAE